MNTTVTEPLPETCGSCGIPSGDGRLLVGWLPCSCPGARHGGHRTYECAACGVTTYRTRHTDDRHTAAYWCQPDRKGVTQ